MPILLPRSPELIGPCVCEKVDLFAFGADDIHGCKDRRVGIILVYLDNCYHSPMENSHLSQLLHVILCSFTAFFFRVKDSICFQACSIMSGSRLLLVSAFGRARIPKYCLVCKPRTSMALAHSTQLYALLFTLGTINLQEASTHIHPTLCSTYDSLTDFNVVSCK